MFGVLGVPLYREHTCFEDGGCCDFKLKIDAELLPYTDFKRTKTLCQGGDCCDFVRHETDAGDGWERTKSI